MSEKDNLLTAYGNAQFDCGNWREQDEFVPSDAEPEWVPYKTYLEASEAAKAALIAHIEKLEAEIAAFRSTTPSLCNCSECRDLRKEFSDE